MNDKFVVNYMSAKEHKLLYTECVHVSDISMGLCWFGSGDKLSPFYKLHIISEDSFVGKIIMVQQ